MNIEKYIESGILEAYVLGASSEAETSELEYLKKRYPEIQDALWQLETDLENIAARMSVTPPPGIWPKIECEINELTALPEYQPLIFRNNDESYNPGSNGFKQEQFIEVESESRQMRVHKAWIWVFAAVFVVAKVFLGCAIYFYLENRQAQQQIQELKTELHQQHLHY